jgi:hypothetical protein
VSASLLLLSISSSDFGEPVGKYFDGNKIPSSELNSISFKYSSISL